MNKMSAKITDIQSLNNLNLVSFDFNGISLSMVSLDLNENIKIGINVTLSAKATNVAIAKNFNGELSYSNQIKAKISSINNGQILSSIKAELNNTILESIITFKSCKRMDLQVGDDILLLIKASELSMLADF
ncbi:MAG: transporter [Sulfurimonas sp.]|nr:MAG: transporter [Sulfurimonas sp.]